MKLKLKLNLKWPTCFSECLSRTPKIHSFDEITPFRVEPKHQWARVVHVVDGDTLTCILRLHARHPYRFSVRLAGVDTCELKSGHPLLRKAASEAQRWVFQRITGENAETTASALNTRTTSRAYFEKKPCYVWIQTTSLDKYGRVLADVFADPSRHSTLKWPPSSAPHSPTSLSTELIQQRLAYPYTGKTRWTDEDQCRYFGLDIKNDSEGTDSDH